MKLRFKLKLTRTTLLLIVAGLCFAASVVLSFVVSQQFQEQSQLKGKLASTQSTLQGIRLENISTQQAELEEQLSQATSQLEAVTSKFSPSAGSNNASNRFFDVAEASGLDVIGMTSSGLTKDKFGGLDCLSIVLDAKIEGKMSNVVSFVSKLNSALVASVVKSVTITVPTSGGDNVSAIIQLVVYTYGGE